MFGYKSVQNHNGVLILPMVFLLRCEPKHNRHFHSIFSQTIQTPSLVGVRHPAALHDHCDKRLGRHRRDHDRGGERGIRDSTGDSAIADGPRAAEIVAGGGGGQRRQGGGKQRQGDGEGVLQQLRVPGRSIVTPTR